MITDLIYSLNWTDIVIWGLSGLAGLGGLYLRSRRKAIAQWWADRRERAEALRSLPQRFVGIAENVEKLAQSNVRTTTQFQAIDEKLDRQSRVMTSHTTMLADISALAHGQMELDSTPRFVCDNAGGNRFVNTAYARLIGCGRDELDGFGYRRFITPSDNPGFIQAFAQSSASHVTFDSEVKFTRVNGTKFIARVRVVPHPEDVPPATHWNGMVTHIREAPDEWRT